MKSYYLHENNFYYISSDSNIIYKYEPTLDNGTNWSFDLNPYGITQDVVNSFSVFNMGNIDGVVVSIKVPDEEKNEIYVLYKGLRYLINSSSNAAEYLYSEVKSDHLLVWAYLSNGSLKLWKLVRYNDGETTDFIKTITDTNISSFNNIDTINYTKGMIPDGKGGFIYYGQTYIKNKNYVRTESLNDIKAVKATSPADSFFEGKFMVIASDGISSLTFNGDSTTLNSTNIDITSGIIDADVSNNKLFVLFRYGDVYKIRTYKYSNTWVHEYNDV